MKKNKLITPGNLLIAQPFMDDSHFMRAVIGICEHDNKEGSMGFILNKPINMKLNELLPDIESDEDFKVYYGGPVTTNSLHYIHNVGDLLEDSIKIGRQLYWGGDFEKLKFLINSQLIKAHNIRFYIGYSGWSVGQLESELKLGTWIVSDWYANYTFKVKSSALWKEALINKGDKYSVIGQMPPPTNHN